MHQVLNEIAIKVANLTHWLMQECSDYFSEVKSYLNSLKHPMATVARGSWGTGFTSLGRVRLNGGEGVSPAHIWYINELGPKKATQDRRMKVR